jgi:prolyl oligopeptidase
MSLTGSPLAPVEEMIHGVLVRDPYRWLEDRGLPETEEWIRQQQRRCEEYFTECEELPSICERVQEYLDVEVVDQPARIGDYYFYRRRARGQEQGCIYVRDITTGEERLLVDLSVEGPFVSAGIHKISPVGSLLAYERKEGGEDRKSIHIVDVRTGARLPCGVERGYARGFVFVSDGSGYLYSQENEVDAVEHIIRFHIFDGLAPDQIIFRVSRTRGSRLALIADEVHLGAILIHEVDSELVEDFWMAEQTSPERWDQVYSNRSLPFCPILKDGRLFAVSHQNAPSGKVVELDLSGQEIRVIVPDQGTVIRQLALSRGHIYISSLNGLYSHIRRWNLLGEEQASITLPQDGTVRLLPDFGDGGSQFLSYESFIQPLSILEHVSATSSLRVWHEQPTTALPVRYRRKDAVYSSVDGTQIPITLVSNMCRETEEPVPAIMTSYGGFGVVMTPQFSVFVTLLMECGAVFALPHIRGGGEFGRAWHDAGRVKNKQNSFDDFAEAAEWLIREGITTRHQLAVFGGSNSGLLVGVAMTQRSDLFRAVLCIAPLLDMVRYEHFDQALKWRPEYGSTDSEEDFNALYAYSPYHHISDNLEYPAVLFVSGDKDERCNPAHVRKMAARMLESTQRVHPVLIDYSDERGHSPALPLNVRIDALARRIAFVCRELNLSFNVGGRHETAGT